MQLEYRNYEVDEESALTARVCFGCEVACFLRCTNECVAACKTSCAGAGYIGD